MSLWIFSTGLARLGNSIFGKELATILGIISLLYFAPYRKWSIYKRIMGDKAKPYPYDEKGKRIYRWNGTPIEPPKEAEVAKEEVPEDKDK